MRMYVYIAYVQYIHYFWKCICNYGSVLVYHMLRMYNFKLQHTIAVHMVVLTNACIVNSSY